jgi:hypothetical protein
MAFTEKRLLFLLCVIVFVIAFILRMAQPDLVEFKRDEATVARLGQAIAYEGYRPVVGVDSSVGIDNLPLTLYLMAIALRIHPDPLVAVIFTTLLNASAVILCYWLTHHLFGTPSALLATALFAVNPWAILYGRKIWCRTMPLFTLGFIISLIAVFVWGKRWALVGAFISLAALLGLQLEGIAFIPVLFLAILLYRDKVSWKPLILGLVICGLLLLPYILFDAKQDWENLRGLLHFSGESGSFSWDAIRYSFSLAGAGGIEGQAGALFEQFRSGIPNLWFTNALIACALGAGLIYAGTQAFAAESQDRRRIFSLLLLWFIIPTFLQLKPATTTQRHYFVLLYPVQFILIGIVIVDGVKTMRLRVMQHFPKFLKGYRILVTILVVSMLIWTGWQIMVTVQLRNFMVHHPTTGGYGIPLRYTRMAANAAKQLAEGAEIIVVSDSTRPMVTETPTVFDALLFNQPHRFVDGRGALPFPASDRTVYLIDIFQNDILHLPLVSYLAELKTVALGPEITLPDGHTYTLYLRTSLDTDDLTSDFRPLSAGIPFSNNVVFAGYRLGGSLQPGEYLHVWLGWWLHGPPPAGVDYHFTVQLNQLIDNDLLVISQDDHAAFPADSWHGGDMILSYFSLPVPLNLSSGIYLVRAGMYSYPEIVPVPVVNPDGQAVDDGVQLVEFTYNQ